MGKEKLFSSDESNWNSSNFGMEIQPTNQQQQLNCVSEQLPSCFFNPSWENSMDQSDPFESALSSMVSSPVAASNITAIPGSGGGDGVVLRELIGRLGSICNSGEISPQSFTGGHNSTNTSCYTTPLNSPPKLNLSMMDHQIRGNLGVQGNHFPGDPGFAERAARFSCFGNSNFGGQQFALNVSDEMPQRVEPRKVVGGSPLAVQQRNDSFCQDRNSLPENQEFGDSKEESSVSEQIPGGENGLKSQSDSNGRKRKAIPKGKEKVNPPPKASSSNGKRSKSDETKTGNEKENSKEKDSAKPEPPKDYIHVRARRGQATDSHSLAERVRREKISERMKFLQDLVPGCNKVTGKAVMLDEIINYVQSLQRQVEFLSMKLATVDPRVDSTSMEALLSKDMFQSQGSVPHNMYPFETTSSPTFPYAAYQPPSQPHNETPFPVNPMNAAALRRNPMPQNDGFGEAPSQASTFWEDDLQSFVQMGFGQIQNQPQNFHGTGQMKVEL